jgi:hypothetical protein
MADASFIQTFEYQGEAPRLPTTKINNLLCFGEHLEVYLPTQSMEVILIILLISIF